MHDEHERRETERRADERERLTRLEIETKAQTKILTQICRDTKAIRNDNVRHELADEKRFGKIEGDLFWTKRIGATLVALLQGVHFWK